MSEEKHFSHMRVRCVASPRVRRPAAGGWVVAALLSLRLEEEETSVLDPTLMLSLPRVVGRDFADPVLAAGALGGYKTC